MNLGFLCLGIIFLSILFWLAVSPLKLEKMIEQRLLSMDANAFGGISCSEFQWFCLSLKSRGLVVEEFRLPCRDGVELNAVFIRNLASRWIINFHMGKNNSLLSCLDFLKQYSAVASVLIVEPRGFGATGGKGTARTIVSDGFVAREWLIKHGIDGNRIIPAGDSLGSGVASAEARATGAPALILTAAYSSIIEVLWEQSFFLRLYPECMFPIPLRLLNNEHNVRVIKKPMLFLHGRNDTFIPIAHAERLLSAAGERGTLVRLDCGHRNTAGANDLAIASFSEGLKTFMAYLSEPAQRQATTTT